MDFELSNKVAVLVLIGGGITCMAYAAITLWWRGRAANDAATGWRVADAEILSVEVIHHPDNDGPDEYEPRVRYAYRVAGRRLEGQQFRIGAKTVMRDTGRAQLAVAKYSSGRRVRIRYNPDKPQLSVLEAVPTASGLWKWVVFGFFLTLSGAYIALVPSLSALWG